MCSCSCSPVPTDEHVQASITSPRTSLHSTLVVQPPDPHDTYDYAQAMQGSPRGDGADNDLPQLTWLVVRHPIVAFMALSQWSKHDPNSCHAYEDKS